MLKNSKNFPIVKHFIPSVVCGTPIKKKKNDPVLNSDCRMMQMFAIFYRRTLVSLWTKMGSFFKKVGFVGQRPLQKLSFRSHMQ
jgi:hypothetical protein